MNAEEFAIKINGLIWREIIIAKGMEAENQRREQQGYLQAYGEEAFIECANEIGRLVELLKG